MIEPLQIQRNVVLAQILEPLADKRGCTTRYQDRTPHLKLQHFQACAVNTGPYYQLLAERFISNKMSQPKVFMDLGLQCLRKAKQQINSLKSINHGIIKTMFPLVMSHLVHGDDVASICAGVPKILRQSSSEDAVAQNEIYRLGFQTSDKQIKKEYALLNCDTTNLFENYLHRERIAPEYGFDPCWAQEFLTGFPTVLRMYDLAKSHVKEDFVNSTVTSYNWAIENTNHGPGMAADLCVAVNYLLLISHRDDAII